MTVSSGSIMALCLLYFAFAMRFSPYLK